MAAASASAATSIGVTRPRGGKVSATAGVPTDIDAPLHLQCCKENTFLISVADDHRPLAFAGELDEAGFSELAAAATARVKDAVGYADASPLPDPATVADGVTGIPLQLRGTQ